jgi:hypothetical protein
MAGGQISEGLICSFFYLILVLCKLFLSTKLLLKKYVGPLGRPRPKRMCAKNSDLHTR